MITGLGEKSMYEVIFYSDNKGAEPIAEIIRDLRQKSYTDKNARINFNKIVAYINLLSRMGTRIGVPVTKHLDGDIWELRPLDNRILYAYYRDNKFILLHHFIKKTKKLPPKELEQAKRNLTDYLERSKE
jgi:phage-related protein